MQYARSILWGLIFLLLKLSTLNAGNTDEAFRPWVYHLNIEHGLPGNWVRSIVQDDHGLMWFGTWNGLASWDGSHLETYRKEDPDTDFLSNMIMFVEKGPEGKLWVGTAGSFVHIYDPDLEKVQHLEIRNDSFKYNETSHCIYFTESYAWIGTNFGLLRYDLSKKTIQLFTNEVFVKQKKSQRIQKITMGPDNYLWLGTPFGIQKFSPEEEAFAFHLESNLLNKENRSINCFYYDQYNRLWVGTDYGLYLYDQSRKSFHLIPDNTQVSGNQKGENITEIAGDGMGNLYVGTSSSGLKIFNFREPRLRKIDSNIDDDHSINSHSIHSIFVDSSGIVWVGTYNGGLNYFKPSHQRFHFIGDSEDGLGNPYVLDVVEDRHDNLWVATENGITKLSADKKSIRKFYPGNDKRMKSNNQSVRTIFFDSYQNLWVSLWSNGLVRMDKNTGAVKDHYIFHDEDRKNQNIHGIEEFKEGILLFAMTNEAKVLDTRNGTIHKINEYFETEGQAFSEIKDFYKAQNSEKLLLALADGLAVINIPERRIERILDNTAVPEIIPYIYTAIYDRNGDYWFGTPNGIFFMTSGGELSKVNLDKLKLSSSYVINITEDRSGNIWFTTYYELVKIPFEEIGKSNINFQVFNYKDGLQRNEFRETTICLSESGNIYLGGNEGLNYFHPEEIKLNMQAPEILLTGIKVNNKDVVAGTKESILKTSIKSTRSITLNHTQTHVGFEFAGLNYLIPGKNEYAYMMEGLDQDWIYIGNKTEANYYRIPPGKYTFRVKASNNDGIWNEEGYSLKLEVLPPWWKSPPFFVTLAVFTILSFVLYFRIKTRNINQRNRLLEARVKAKTSELLELNAQLKQQNLKITNQKEQVENLARQLHESDQQKLKLFTSISHEFRTPLTLIIDPIENMLKTAYQGQKNQLLLIKRSADRLMKLVDQIIDLRKIDQKVMKLSVSDYDLGQVLKEILDMFHENAEKKGIRIVFNSSGQVVKAWFDKDKLEKIMFNLLSNSMKYTQEGGVITISSNIKKDKGTQYALIEVKDDGMGIADEDLPLIFDRFYTTSGESGHTGIGIGLSFCKELLELHKGSINVNSIEGEGTAFSMKIPVSRDFYDESVLKQHKPGKTREAESLSDAIDMASVPDEMSETEYVVNKIHNDSLPVILIVEDHHELRKHLISGLYELGNIYEAENGLVGADLARAIIPDLIVSDIMMPAMDGISLCEKIKNDPLTDHIPVILLTARSGQEDELEGLSKGADDYVVKPFHMDILITRIRNIFTLKAKIREQYQKNHGVVLEENTYKSTHEKYLNYLTRIIEENIEDPDFSVETLSSILNMDRFQLYRKIHSITGLSPSRFITRIKLSNAVERLKNTQATVSEVAFDLGFSSPSYFARCFREVYGVQPSRYLDQLRDRERHG